MAKGINKVILVGNLGKDVQTSATRNNKMVARFSVATEKQWKDANGQPQSHTEWHNCVAFEKLAEICNTWLKKGSKVYLEGELHTSQWQDTQTNETKYRTEIILNQLLMLDPPKEGGAPKPATPPPAPPADAFDDDLIPF